MPWRFGPGSGVLLAGWGSTGGGRHQGQRRSSFEREMESGVPMLCCCKIGLGRGLLPPTCRLSGTGFLILRPDREAGSRWSIPSTCFLSLLLSRSSPPGGTVLSHPPTKASYRLGEACTTCRFFWTCYREAINEVDIQFLPGLSEGEFWKLRQLGLSTIENAGKWFELTSTSHKPEGDKSG